MQFQDVAGQSQIKHLLVRSAQQGRIPHAQLFSGKHGHGTLPMALAYIQYLLCEQPSPQDSCGACAGCKKVGKLSHPDLHFAFPFAAKDDKDVAQNHLEDFRAFLLKTPYGSVESWHEFNSGESKRPAINSATTKAILTEMSQKPYEGKLQFMLLWYPELITHGMANRLLKSIEEPPPSTVFILVSEEEGKLMPTLLSRLQTIAFPKVNDFDLAAYLGNNMGLELERVRELVNMADGDVDYALSLGNVQEQLAVFFPFFRDWMRGAYMAAFHETIELAEVFQKWGRTQQMSFFQYGLYLIREALVFKTSNSLSRITELERSWLERFSGSVNAAVAESIMQALENGLQGIAGNAHQKTEFIGVTIDIYRSFKLGNQ
jgi:DNA polymerase III subunit delta'